jgi:LuxR family transcriptional regulator, maltose regulon positive regulatory protein
LQEARKENRVGNIIEILILQALVHDASGHLELATGSLKEAIFIAEYEEYFQIFVDEVIPMHRLLSELVVCKPRPDYVLK